MEIDINPFQPNVAFHIEWFIVLNFSLSITYEVFSPRNDILTLREKCPNTELFLARTFLYSDCTRRFTKKVSVVNPNTGKYGPEITPYLDSFHAV